MEGIISFIEVGKIIYDDINNIFRDIKGIKREYDLALSHCTLDFNRGSTNFSVKCNYHDAEHKRELFFEKKKELYNKIDAYNRILRLYDDEDGYYEIEREFCCCKDEDKFIIQKHEFDDPIYRW